MKAHCTDPKDRGGGGGLRCWVSQTYQSFPVMLTSSQIERGGVMFDIPPGVSKYDNQGGFRQPGKTRTAVSD